MVNVKTRHIVAGIILCFCLIGFLSFTVECHVHGGVHNATSAEEKPVGIGKVVLPAASEQADQPNANTPPPPPAVKLPPLLKLVIQWPRQGADPKMIAKLPETLTIHGMWALTDNGSNCPKAAYHTSPGMTALAGDLNKFWLSNRAPNLNLWTGEWVKHGYCTGLSQEQYFTNALKAYKSRETFMGSAFKKGDYYDEVGLWTAVSNAFGGVKPEIKCDRDYVKEIRMFVDTATWEYVDSAIAKNCSRLYKKFYFA